MLRTIRQSTVGAPLATTLCVSMALYGCASDGATEEPVEETGSVTPTYTFTSVAPDGSSVHLQLQPDGVGLSGLSTVTHPDGSQQTDFVTVPDMDYGITLEMVQDPDGSRFLRDVGTGERLEVHNYVEGPDGISFRTILPGGAPVDVTLRGDGPFFVCGGACLAALVAGGALLVCGIALALSMINCSMQGRCWAFEFAGGSLKEKIVAACSGRCEDWKAEN